MRELYVSRLFQNCHFAGFKEDRRSASDYQKKFFKRRVIGNF